MVKPFEVAVDHFCAAALPYIKAKLGDEGGSALALSENDSPVVRDLGNGLLVVYVVDSGQSFQYVQNRHLESVLKELFKPPGDSKTPLRKTGAPNV